MKPTAKSSKRRKRPVRKATKLPRKKAAARSSKQGSGYSPRVVVKYRDDVKLPYDDRIDGALDDLPDGHWRRIKQRFPGITIRVLINSITPSEIRELVAEAKRRDDSYQPPNFLTFYVVDLPAKVDADELVKALLSWRIVETAYFDPPGRDPHRTVAKAPLCFNDPFLAMPSHLDPGEVGIDAFFAWSQPGGKGEATRIIDLERGWTLNHVDLNAHGALRLGGTLWMCLVLTARKC